MIVELWAIDRGAPGGEPSDLMGGTPIHIRGGYALMCAAASGQNKIVFFQYLTVMNGGLVGMLEHEWILLQCGVLFI